MGCSVTFRATPAVTVDSTGHVGAQLLVGAGLAAYRDGDYSPHRSIAIGLGGGYGASGGDLKHAVILDEYLEYVRLPATADGFSPRIGIHFGLRPATFDVEGSSTLFSAGLAAGVAYRISDHSDRDSMVDHFIGVEARCDVLQHWSDQRAAPVPAICAVGPQYEIVFRAVGGMAHL